MLSLNVMLPVFLMILLGTFLRQINLIPKQVISHLNNLCFKVFLPIMLFNNVRQTDFSLAFDPWLIGYTIGCVLVIFFSLCILVPKFVPSPAQQSVVIQGWYRSNYVIFGLPIIISIYGEGHVAIITMLIAFVVPLFNLLAVVLFEKFNPRGGYSLKQLILSICANPLIIATLLGLLSTTLDLQFPFVLHKTLTDLGGVTLPLALLVLGADLNLNRQTTDYKLLIGTVLGRTLVIPMIFIPLSIALGLRGEALASLMVLFASPAAVSGYVMAQNAHADHQLAGQIVVFTSLISCFTFFILIALLKYFLLI